EVMPANPGRRHRLVALLALLGAAAGARAGPSDRPAAAVGAAADIHLDGVLDEPAWSRAPPIGPLWQSDPSEGAPASEGTEVRLLSDAANLYSGIPCHDRAPSAIVSTQLARDASLDVDDSVTVVIDPFLDHKNGFFFVVNPAGARADGQISNNATELSYDW